MKSGMNKYQIFWISRHHYRWSAHKKTFDARKGSSESMDFLNGG